MSSTKIFTCEGFGSRLKSAMAAAGIKNQQELAAKLTVSQAAVSGWMHDTIPQKRLLHALASLVKCSPDWLRTGAGSKAPVIGSNVREESPPPNMRWVKVVSWATAGAAKDYTDMETFLDERVPTQSLDENAFGLIVEGDSMEPKISEGDYVTVSPNKEARSGNIVIARTRKDHGVYLKKYFLHGERATKVRLVSLNTEYPPLEFERSDFSFIYPVVGLFRKM